MWHPLGEVETWTTPTRSDTVTGRDLSLSLLLSVETGRTEDPTLHSDVRRQSPPHTVHPLCSRWRGVLVVCPGVPVRSSVLRRTCEFGTHPD